MTILNFFIGLLAAIVIIVIILGLIFSAQYLVWFHCKPCKHCGHTLEYRGIIRGKDEEIVYFECPKCGRKEMIPKQEFFKDCDKAEYNPNNLWP